ncbi:hypothetical protein FY034_13030 [Trichlorobacter lovleyi]|uniref:hypothetical protein n=1 Tax=Trichlorobacter lovleyi TaxID=313985 RepID=UPI00223F1009|nr:hypothetical protein [Trichlorobacter lovleyi]QOX79815.1 hypothetical protein FY034_13030 [Trichlorobacter lovleyi]
MFYKTREEALILKEYKRSQLLNMYRKALTKVSNLKLGTLQVTASAGFTADGFHFEINVFELNGTNTSLTIYDFWELKQSQKLVDGFITAIKSGNFDKVQAARRTV